MITTEAPCWGIDAGRHGTKFVKLSINDDRQVEGLETGFYEEKDRKPNTRLPTLSIT